MKTWDVLNRESGAVVLTGWPVALTRLVGYGLLRHEVAYCRETGEVVYL